MCFWKVSYISCSLLCFQCTLNWRVKQGRELPNYSWLVLTISDLRFWRWLIVAVSQLFSIPRGLRWQIVLNVFLDPQLLKRSLSSLWRDFLLAAVRLEFGVFSSSSWNLCFSVLGNLILVPLAVLHCNNIQNIHKWSYSLLKLYSVIIIMLMIIIRPAHAQYFLVYKLN